jgi:hypothetical protein
MQHGAARDHRDEAGRREDQHHVHARAVARDDAPLEALPVHGLRRYFRASMRCKPERIPARYSETFVDSFGAWLFSS